MNLLKNWLQGHSYETFYRPIPIEEHLVYDGKIYPASSTTGLFKPATQLHAEPHLDAPPTLCSAQPVRLIDASVHKELQDAVRNAVVALAAETVGAGYGVLVFCSSRGGCEADALLISRALPGADLLDQTTLEKRLNLLADFQSLSTGLDQTLENTIPKGVVFHHAGLTTEERDLVANAFDSGIVKVCVATCSLAAGINLPARRVILHNVRMGRDLVGPSMLRQMRGRAGRKGKDEVGETYLCCRKDDLENVVELMHADLPQITSCLMSEKRRIQRALLEVIAIRLATSRSTLDEYASKTMHAHTTDEEALQLDVTASLADLETMGFITPDAFSSYKVTQLGKAIVASGLDPEDGLFIHAEMKKALQAFVLDGEMHVLYNFTPVQNLAGTIINWQMFGNEMDRLDESGLRVMGFLGLKPALVQRLRHSGGLKETTPEEKELARRYRRFYLAFQLRDLCNEVPIHRVALKYEMPRGVVQNLAQTCQGFAAGMVKFCEHMGWGYV
jgi:replicative superfamily II helicase